MKPPASPEVTWPVYSEIAKKEIGDHGIDELRRLRHFLYARDGELSLEEEMIFRAAPSLVARSEIELFGTSMPRFAFRAYLRAGSFVNARRIEVFRDAVRSMGKRRPEGPAWKWLSGVDEITGADDALAVDMPRSSCVGDSLLAPPQRLIRSSYHVCTTELGKAYGENQAIEGTPYVKHMRLGGGLCAQANCLMATMLLQEYAKGIHGVAEITRIAASASGHRCNEIDLGGMRREEMISYFCDEQVGLYACEQFVELPKDPDMEVRMLDRFALALHAYLSSNMPASIPVDAGLVWGCGGAWEDGILPRNQVSGSRPVRSAKRRPHAVLAVGCHRKNYQEFLLSDPGQWPLLQANGRQIAEARPYRREGNLARRNQIRTLAFLAVTPKAVKLPLLDVRTSQGERLSGLLSIAGTMQELRGMESCPWPVRTGVPGVPGRFRLTNLAWRGSEDKADQERLERDLKHLPGGARSLLVKMLDRGQLSATWCWCQRRPPWNRRVREVWVWDATQAPARRGERRLGALRDRYLHAVLSLLAGQWECPWHRAGVQITDSPREEGRDTFAEEARKPVSPSLLSSFITRPFVFASEEWPSGLRLPCDLYAFMQPDVDSYCRRKRAPGAYPTAVEAMAEWADKPDAISYWVDRVHSAFDAQRSPVVGLASFIPEATRAEDSDAGKAARGAIRFLMRFARELNRTTRHRVRTIELVGGAQMDGIWLGRRRCRHDEDERRYYANAMDDEEALGRLVATLRDVVRETGTGDAGDPVYLALELEPGPLYCIRNKGTLGDFCRAIQDDPLLSPVVGVNLDISHYRLARITPREVLDCRLVRNRIVHAHISGHHRCGHLGDLPLLDLNDEKDFLPWLELLETANAGNRPADLPPFSGHVSLEMEATMWKRSLTRSVELLDNMCRRAYP